MISLSDKLAHPTKEAAAIMGVSEKTLLRWYKEGRLHGVRIGARRLLFPRESIMQFLNSGRDV